MTRHKSSPEQNAMRFWSKVDRSAGPDACWPYQGYLDRDGYGDFWLDGATRLAHRVAYLLTKGEWPEPAGCHTCDNPACCNPAHILPCTMAVNCADRDAKGRHWVQHGEGHADARLTDDTVREIRALYQSGGCTYASLGKRFGVHFVTVSDVIRRKTWKHVA